MKGLLNFQFMNRRYYNKFFQLGNNLRKEWACVMPKKVGRTAYIIFFARKRS